MKVLRTTLLHPRSGRQALAIELLDALDNHLSHQPGFVESFELAGDVDKRTLGRVSVWEDRKAADRAAIQIRTIALKSQLQIQCLPGTEEHMLEVVSERRAA